MELKRTWKKAISFMLALVMAFSFVPNIQARADGNSAISFYDATPKVTLTYGSSESKTFNVTVLSGTWSTDAENYDYAWSVSGLDGTNITASNLTTAAGEITFTTGILTPAGDYTATLTGTKTIKEGSEPSEIASGTVDLHVDQKKINVVVKPAIYDAAGKKRGDSGFTTEEYVNVFTFDPHLHHDEITDVDKYVEFENDDDIPEGDSTEISDLVTVSLGTTLGAGKHAIEVKAKTIENSNYIVNPPAKAEDAVYILPKPLTVKYKGGSTTGEATPINFIAAKSAGSYANLAKQVIEVTGEEDETIKSELLSYGFDNVTGTNPITSISSAPLELELALVGDNAANYDITFHTFELQSHHMKSNNP